VWPGGRAAGAERGRKGDSVRLRGLAGAGVGSGERSGEEGREPEGEESDEERGVSSSWVAVSVLMAVGAVEEE